jgi:hypothetical protein
MPASSSPNRERASRNQGSLKYVLGRKELIPAAQQDTTAGVSPINQISGLTRGVEREAPFPRLR